MPRRLIVDDAPARAIVPSFRACVYLRRCGEREKERERSACHGAGDGRLRRRGSVVCVSCHEIKWNFMVL